MITRDLPAIGALMDGALSSVDREASGPPVVDSRLHCSYSPRANWRYETPPPTDHGSLWGHSARVAGPWAEPAPLGLSLARNSYTPPKRNGWKGLTDTGRKAIHRSCAVLDDATGRLVFWTVTLSPVQLQQLEELDAWPQFQNALRHRLVRALQKRGFRAWVIGVVEMHPQRTRSVQKPQPHIHVCFEGRSHRRGRWWLSLETLDAIIVKALKAAGVTDLDVKACGNAQGVKRSVGRYLSHYMKKGTVPPANHGEGWELCPRQWWFQSRGLRAVVLRTVARLPVRLVLWIHRNHDALEEECLLWWRRMMIADPRAPATYGVQFQGLESLALVVARWQEAEWEAEWQQTYHLTRSNAI